MASNSSRNASAFSLCCLPIKPSRRNSPTCSLRVSKSQASNCRMASWVFPVLTEVRASARTLEISLKTSSAGG